jgi:RND family efflux transporter MFP subunit
MKPRWGSIMGLVVTLTVVGSAAAFWILHLGGATKAESPKSPPPAVQTAAVKEGELNVITLTPEAEARLGIKTEKLEKRKVERVRVLGGEMVLPAGRAVTISSPFAGTVRVPSNASLAPGQLIKKGQAVVTLVPLLTNEARTALATSLVEAEGLARNADVQLKAAAVALNRAKQLLAEDAGSKRGADEAQAAYDVAQKTLEAAEARRHAIAKALEGSDASSATSLAIESPTDGIVRNVFVAAGQPVAAGAPLFEVADQGTLWLRVPVYVGELGDLALDRPATVSRVGDRSGDQPATANPVAAPPSATAATASKDLYYEIDNRAAAWVPGQRASVVIPAKSQDESLVIPWSAVVHDVNGGAWVYEAVAPRKYARQRVDVRNVTGTDAVLITGPRPGTAIVTQGVAELFGKEMGFAK